MDAVSVALKVSVDSRIYDNEHAFYFGEKSAELVTFVYIHKSGRETEKRMTYRKAYNLAMERAKDGRYKNYEYFITL